MPKDKKRSSRLSNLTVQRARRPGMYADGGGLYLQVINANAKSWIYRYMLDGRARAMGLGPAHLVTLAEARELATDQRRLRLAGIDPIEKRKADRAQARLEAAKAMTFKEAAEQYISAHKAGWKNAKHAAQWTSTLETYAYPVIGALPIQGIDVSVILKVLEPIWTKKPETASRVRGRIESILDWATARGYRAGVNPARWRGHLENLLPAPAKVRTVKHHAALPYGEVASFLADLRAQEGTAARALEFLILTAVRTGEVIGAKLGEVNVREAVWTIRADRTKSRREHRVPLSAPALAIVKAAREGREADADAYVFEGGKKDRPLSNMAMLALLKRMGRSDLTAHGFRSTFRDWAADRTSYPNEVAEMALGHVIGDKVEAAYRRGDLFDKRKRMMADWATFCETPAPAQANVVNIGGRGA